MLANLLGSSDHFGQPHSKRDIYRGMWTVMLAKYGLLHIEKEREVWHYEET